MSKDCGTLHDAMPAERERMHLEYGDEVGVIARGPLFETLSILCYDEWREHVSVWSGQLPGRVVLDCHGCGYRGLEIRMHVQLLLPLERRLLEVELDGHLRDPPIFQMAVVSRTVYRQQQQVCAITHCLSKIPSPCAAM